MKFKDCSASPVAHEAIINLQSALITKIGIERIARLSTNDDSNVDLLIANIAVNSLAPEIQHAVELCRGK